MTCLSPQETLEHYSVKLSDLHWELLNSIVYDLVPQEVSLLAEMFDLAYQTGAPSVALEPSPLTIRELMDESWQHAENKGFHAANKTFAEDCALFHSEISEALEEYRNGHKPNEIYYHPADLGLVKKPEGVPIELADVLIRIFDVSKTHGIDLEAALRLKLKYNRGRPHLHGGKQL